MHKNMWYLNPDISIGASVNEPVSNESISRLKEYVSSIKTEEGSIDENAISIGEWGTVYHYNISIKNTGSKRNLIFGTETHDSKIIIKYSVNGIQDVEYCNVGSNGQGITEKSIPLKENTITNIKIEYMLIYGVAGTGNFLNVQ